MKTAAEPSPNGISVSCRCSKSIQSRRFTFNFVRTLSHKSGITGCRIIAHCLSVSSVTESTVSLLRASFLSSHGFETSKNLLLA